MNKKNLNNKGFTLIELLAVITIMGILMMVAIPAVTRTIENSRRDSFNTIAKSYMDAIRNAWVSDNIVCYYSGSWTVASGVAGKVVADGATGDAAKGEYYYVPICSGKNTGSASASGCIEYGTGDAKMTVDSINGATLDLMESGGKSSFGNADIYGVVRVEKIDTAEKVTNGVVEKAASTKLKYSILIGDTGKHGYSGYKTDKELTRTNVQTALSKYPTSSIDGNGTAKVDANYCKLS